MARYVVLVGYRSASRTCPAGSVIELTDAEAVQFESSGCAMVPYTPQMEPVLRAYAAVRGQQAAEIDSDARLVALLLARGLPPTRGLFADRPAPTLANLGLRYVATDFPWNAVVEVFDGVPRWMPVDYASLAENGWEQATLGGALPAYNFRFAQRAAPGVYAVASVAGQAADSTVFTSDGTNVGFGFFGGWGVVDIMAAPIQSRTIVMADTDGSAIPWDGVGAPLGVIFGYGTPGSAVNVWLFS